MYSNRNRRGRLLAMGKLEAEVFKSLHKHSASIQPIPQGSRPPHPRAKVPQGSREKEVSLPRVWGPCAGTPYNKETSVLHGLPSTLAQGCSHSFDPSFCCICVKTPTPNYFNGRRRLGTAGNCC